MRTEVRVGDRVAVFDPSTGETLQQGVVLRPPKDSSILRQAIYSYVQFDRIDEPQWYRRDGLEVIQAHLNKSIQVSGTIGILPNVDRSKIFLTPKKH